ncbi:MAG TPA: CDP-diacylglycerol--serine O-phosphatidyltransferase [Gemmatimonadales bacterium]|nr:CDP-diacylglycerol--serine O-phosphatidyltransferase [Gemmatimonadales bacterium]
MTEPDQRIGMRRAIVILPGAFTSGNLFFGLWAIVSAARGNFTHAAYFIVLAGVMDVLDGRVARMSRTGTRFGAEMDSLVDAISFGVAPGLLVFFHTYRGGDWAWLLSFMYVLAVVVRLARFNIEQAGHAKATFFGLPSPAAGMTLATFWPFSQTQFFQEQLAGATSWPTALAVLMVLASLLMVSHVPYPVWPRMGLRTASGLFGTAFSLGVLASSLYFPAYFLFPLGLAYIGYGLVRAVVVGFLERLPEKDPLRDEEADAERPTEDHVTARLISFDQKERRRSGGDL